eukprot:3238494-Prymnesium_polylepis.2
MLERAQFFEVVVGPRPLEAKRPHLDQRAAASHEEGVRQAGAVRPHEHIGAPRRRHVVREASSAKLVRLTPHRRGCRAGS